ncbi:MAG: serine hydrolase domain-containing protein, partial [Bacteroidota bacterium]
YADILAKEKLTSQHLFRLWSISRFFTKLALLQALEQTSYILNSSISEIDPKIPFYNTWETTDLIRVIHLLEQASGFDDYHSKAMDNRKDHTYPPLKDMMLSYKNSWCTRWQLGGWKAYGSSEYQVAGYPVETLSGEIFANYTQGQMLDLLEMLHSAYDFKQPRNLLFAKLMAAAFYARVLGASSALFF